MCEISRIVACIRGAVMQTLVNLFIHSFLNLFEKHVPLCNLDKSCSESHWYIPKCERARQLIDLAHDAFVNDSSDTNKKYRNKHNTLINSVKHDFGVEYFATEQNNKVLWKKVNELGVLKVKSNQYNGITSDDQDILEVSDSFEFKEVNAHDCFFSKIKCNWH